MSNNKKDLIDSLIDDNIVDIDNPFSVIEKLGKVMQWVADHIPLWVIVLIGLGVAIFVPVIIKQF